MQKPSHFGHTYSENSNVSNIYMHLKMHVSRNTKTTDKYEHEIKSN